MDKCSSGGAVRVIAWRWSAVVHHVKQKQTGQETGWSRAGVWKWPGVRSSEETGFHWALIESKRACGHPLADSAPCNHGQASARAQARPPAQRDHGILGVALLSHRSASVTRSQPS